MWFPVQDVGASATPHSELREYYSQKGTMNLMLLYPRFCAQHPKYPENGVGDNAPNARGDADTMYLDTHYRRCTVLYCTSPIIAINDTTALLEFLAVLPVAPVAQRYLVTL